MIFMKNLSLLVMLFMISGCGVWGPKEKWVYVGSLSTPPPLGVQQIVVGVPSGKLDWNGYLAFWRHADYYEITYLQQEFEPTANIVKLRYDEVTPRNLHAQEIKTHPKSKLSVSVPKCSAEIELFNLDQSPIDKINGNYKLFNCKTGDAQHGQ
jgi:hypothetical protein